MIDNKGKLFGKINIIDLSVILIVLLALILTFVKFNYNPVKNDKTQTTIQYTLMVKGVRDFTVNAFKEGDEIFESTSENSLGKIVSIHTKETEKYMADANGDFKLAIVPEQNDLFLTIECNGVVGDKGLETLTGETIQLNKTLTIFNKYCQTNFEIKEIKTDN